MALAWDMALAQGAYRQGSSLGVEPPIGQKFGFIRVLYDFLIL